MRHKAEIIRRRRNAQLQAHLEDDPITGVANLFDVAMVFSVALMAAMVNYLGVEDLLFSEAFTIVKNPGKDTMEIITKKGKALKRYEATSSEASKGNGKKVGVAYQLESGQVVYIPE